MLKELASNPKIAAAAATATTSTGVGQYLEMIPSSDLIKISTILGIILSVVLIYTHIKKMIYDSKMQKLMQEKVSYEVITMKRKEKERLATVMDLKRRAGD
tara:strand:- start:9746 stop:10048 length:303 start_codon:yes stop_codon:yes gene_type:complete